MTKPKRTNPGQRLTNLADAWEGPPGMAEDPDVKRKRLANELEEYVDRQVETNRQRDDRKAAYAAYRPRYEALRQMAHSTIAESRIESAATRRAKLHKDPVFKSLTEHAQFAWDSNVEAWTETIRTGDMGSVWKAIGELADHQASNGLADWDPPAAETFDTVADVAAIPRG